MWKLIKTELIYYKNLWVILYSLMVPFLIANLLRPGFEKQLARIMIITMPIMGVVMNAEEKKSKKNPLYARLPVPLRHIGMARQATWLIFWMSLVVCFTITSAIGLSDSSSGLMPWFVLSMLGAVIVFVTGVTIIQDLRFCVSSAILDKALTVFSVVFLATAAAIYLVITISTSIGAFLANIFVTPFGALSLCVVAIGFLILRVRVFEHRHSYLE